MAIELPLSDFWIINFSFFKGDFLAVNYSGHKSKGAPFSLQELNKKYTQSFFYIMATTPISFVLTKY